MLPKHVSDLAKSLPKMDKYGLSTYVQSGYRLRPSLMAHRSKFRQVGNRLFLVEVATVTAEMLAKRFGTKPITLADFNSTLKGATASFTRQATDVEVEKWVASETALIKERATLHLKSMMRQYNYKAKELTRLEREAENLPKRKAKLLDLAGQEAKLSHQITALG